MKTKNIFSFIVLIILIIISFYLNSFYWVFSFLGTLFIYYVLAYIIYVWWKKLRKKDYIDYREFAIWFLYKISLFMVIISSILWAFAYYQNEISPAPMPRYTISNWDKEVVFQAMSHIWSKRFYNTIRNDLREYKSASGVYFYEWVRPWSNKNKKDFNKAIWIKFSKGLYKNFWKLYGVNYQDNSIYYNLVNNLDFNIDLSIDDIMKLYNLDPKKTKTVTPPVDATKAITDTLTSLNDRELQILVYINKSILNFIIKSDLLKNTITNNFWNKKLFDVILWERNKVLSSAIIKSEYKKIYITYWLLHFKGVLELLKQNDSKWKIIDVRKLYPIR